VVNQHNELSRAHRQVGGDGCEGYARINTAQ